MGWSWLQNSHVRLGLVCTVSLLIGASPAAVPAQSDPAKHLARIFQKPGDRAAVERAQRARVMALMTGGQFEKALAEAKSYYNVVALSATREATDLLAEVLEKARGPVVAAQFRAQQLARAAEGEAGVVEDLGENVLVSIHVDPVVYEPALQKRLRPRNVGDLLARGNILLLADRSAEARKCFEEACDLAAKDGKHIGWTIDAVEGIARSIRAETGSPSKADKFILELRRQRLVNAGPSKHNDMRAAALQILTSGIATEFLPDLELARIRAEERLDGADDLSSLRVLADFECASPLRVRTLSPTHLEITVMPQSRRLCDWFLFCIEGARGRTIRIDMKAQDASIGKWWTLNPLYTDAELDRSDTYSQIEQYSLTRPATGRDGALLPTKSSGRWHYIPDAWRADENTLAFVHEFSADRVYLAMRVPYLPSYSQNWMGQIASSPFASSIEIGRTPGNRPLFIIRVGTVDDEPAPGKPCVLIYAGEHADEHDSMWVARGVVDFLLSDHDEAKYLRDTCTFLVIPLLDPDATAASAHEGMIASFWPGRTTPETIAYANWFKAWVDSGKRLDLVINLHNVQSRESPHIACALLEAKGNRGRLSTAVHQLLIKRFHESGLSTSMRPWRSGISPNRLGGWLSSCYGPLTLAYEINSQSADRHLSLQELGEIGGTLAVCLGEFLHSTEGKAVLAEVDACRRARLARWAAFGESRSEENAVLAEARRAANLIGGTAPKDDADQ